MNILQISHKKIAKILVICLFLTFAFSNKVSAEVFENPMREHNFNNARKSLYDGIDSILKLDSSMDYYLVASASSLLYSEPLYSSGLVQSLTGRISYKIIDETYSSDVYTFTLSIDGVNGTEVLTSSALELAPRLLMSLGDYNKLFSEDNGKSIFDCITKHIKSSKSKTFVADVRVISDNHGGYIIPIVYNKELIDALTGGVFSSLSDFGINLDIDFE